MVWEFTEEDRLREQDRLHEAWLRDRQYEKYAKKQMIDELRKLRKERKKFNANQFWHLGKPDYPIKRLPKCLICQKTR